VGRALLSAPARLRARAVAAAPQTDRAWHVWGAFALLLALVTLPICSTVLPPLFDYPNHLARMHLLAEGGDRFYAVRWAPLPNLAEDLIVPPLARLMPLEIAGRLFLVMIFALIAGGALCLNRVVVGGWRMWPLLAFLLLYNRIFLWGFLNYLFGLGVALFGVALWLALEQRRVRQRTLASALMALLCFFSHIAAFGVYSLAICGLETPPATAELRARRWPALGRRAALVGVQFIGPAVLFLGWRREVAGGGISYAGFARKADLLFSVLDNYHRPFDIACFALFLALGIGLAASGRLGLAPRLGWAAGLVFTAYLLLPNQIYGGSGADHRLPIAFFLLLVAGSAPRFPSRRAAIAIGTAAALLLTLRIVAIELVWRRADRVYAADLAGIDALPRGAALAVAYPADTVHVVQVPQMHLAALATVRREAFVPTLFAIAGQQPIAVKPPYSALAEAAQPQLLWAAFVDGGSDEQARVAPALKEFDYVAFTDQGAVHVPPSPCLAPVFRQPTFQIFVVRHDASCGRGLGG
jgi:hypothetical protein